MRHPQSLVIASNARPLGYTRHPPTVTAHPSLTVGKLRNRRLPLPCQRTPGLPSPTACARPTRKATPKTWSHWSPSPWCTCRMMAPLSSCVPPQAETFLVKVLEERRGKTNHEDNGILDGGPDVCHFLPLFMTQAIACPGD